MITKNEIIIFDGDDTLWKTQELYETAKKEFHKLMKSQGISEDNVIDFLDNLDSKRVRTKKFSKTRFLESMIITYAILCGRYHKHWNIYIEEKITGLGFSIFTTPKLYEDTLPVLEMLSKDYDLLLYTVGDEKFQKEKLSSFGKEFKSYFLKIYICEMKTKRKLRKILSDLKIPAEKVWVIGNSVKSDINPALKIGLKTILIPRGTWKYEESKLYSEDVLIVHSLKEAANIILGKKLEGNINEFRIS